MALIGNDPNGFDPSARERATRGRPRGMRFRTLLLGGIGLVAPAILLQQWVFGWRDAEETETTEIRTVNAAPPTFRFEQPKEEPPPPPPPEPQPEVRRPARGAQAPKLPTQVAFNVQPQGEPDMSWFADGRRPHLAHGCALRPGASVIHAALESTVQSEVAGQAIATVTEDVFDADGVGRLLIPAGTKAVGVYKTGGSLDFQRRRLDFVWTELTMPDGTQLYLAESDGMDVAGSMGVGGEVRTRWGELIATAALFTVFDGIARGGVSDDPSLAGAMQSSASRNTGRLGKEITGRVLDWEPDILVAAGTRIIISPRRTIQVC